MSTLATTSGAVSADTSSEEIVPVVSILVVDDNPAKRLALRAVLTPLNYAIVEAVSGLDALRCVLAQDFAVILLDVRMPNMDGFETAGRIRQRKRCEMTPIIFITAFNDDELVTTDRYSQDAPSISYSLPSTQPHCAPRCRSSPRCSWRRRPSPAMPRRWRSQRGS